MEDKYFRRFCRGIVRFIVHILYRVEYVGEKYPSDGPCILCPNHLSVLDIVYVLLYSRTRWVYFMAKSELYKTKLSTWFMNKMGAFPIRRGKSDVRSILKAISLLQNGEMVCIFPQGTRQKSSEVLPPRRGVAMIAAMTGAPVVPIFISRKAKATKKTTVYIGKPIYTGLSRKSTKEEISAKSLELMDLIYDLSEVYHKQ